MTALVCAPMNNKVSVAHTPVAKTLYANYCYSLTGNEQSAIQVWLRFLPEKYRTEAWGIAPRIDLHPILDGTTRLRDAWRAPQTGFQERVNPNEKHSGPYRGVG